jgi:UDP-2,3-diacylglucosamine pyrophosphatase LpxH
MHTIVLSDLHLADAEPLDPRRPHWKAFKRREFFVDADVERLLEHVLALDEPAELVLNGDVFDFDTVMEMPPPAPGQREGTKPSPVHWLMRLRGLSSEEWMSVFKMDCIVRDHRPWFEALGRFVARGHRLIFVIGNHDLELHWPVVQQRIRAAMAMPPGCESKVVFCNWFYLSGGDTFISHGNQYDPYCAAPDPIHPLIEVRGRPRVRIPFGDLANRYMLNGMGYFNPHATANYIMSGLEYATFFFRYMVRDQPLLIWTWFWSACVTLVTTLDEFLRPAMRDPLQIEEKVAGIAERSQATPSMVRQLAAVDVPSACTRPLMIARELWLDRGLLFLGMVYVAVQAVLAINYLWPISPLWVLLPLTLLFPLFLTYSFRVRPETFSQPLLTPERAGLIARITGTRFAVFGHTHEPELRPIGPLLFANAGFWSPAFAEPECRTRIGTQTFAWLRPGPHGRTLTLWEWPPGGTEPRPFTP